MIIILCFKTKQNISKNVSVGNVTSYFSKAQLKEKY